jgi:hypothetical protein
MPPLTAWFDGRGSRRVHQNAVRPGPHGIRLKVYWCNGSPHSRPTSRTTSRLVASGPQVLQLANVDGQPLITALVSHRDPALAIRCGLPPRCQLIPPELAWRSAIHFDGGGDPAPTRPTWSRATAGDARPLRLAVAEAACVRPPISPATVQLNEAPEIGLEPIKLVNSRRLPIELPEWVEHDQCSSCPQYRWRELNPRGPAERPLPVPSG